MKQIVLFLFITTLLSACSDNRLNESTLVEGKELVYSFAIHLVEEEQGSTRNSETIDDLYLLVFDENHRMLSKNKAILEEVTSLNDGKVLRFKVILLSSTKNRIIHFISNYPHWDDFPSTHEIMGVDEGNIIPQMSSANMVYWGRFEFDRLTPGSFDNKTFPLLRNKAKVVLLNEASNFWIVDFALHNGNSLGTIAPFRYNGVNQTYEFKEGLLTEVNPVDLEAATWVSYMHQNYTYVFDKNNQTSSEKVFLIVEGYFEDRYKCYYKVDLVKDASSATLHNIIRNHIYEVKIKKVTARGYNTVKEAVDNPASNNILGSVELKDYPSVSDGKGLLKVSRIAEVFVKPGIFESLISYYPDFKSSITKPTGVNVQLVSDNSGNDISNLIYNSATGLLRLNVLKIPVDSEITHSIKVVTKDSEQNDLIRYISLYLRRPYNKEFNFSINNFNMSNQEDRVVIQFNVPSTIAKNVFPIELNIKTKELYPDPKYKDLEVKIENKDYSYIYRIQEQSKGSTVTLYFKRTVSNKREIIAINSSYTETVNLILESD